jgi:hypothetical protein
MDAIEPAPPSGPLAPLLDPDSQLVATALDLLQRHTAELASSICKSCGAEYPCESGVHAALVCRAAGLDPDSMGRPDALSRYGLAG